MTGKGKAIVLCLATIESCTIIDNPEQYNAMREFTRIDKGSVFDWKQNTKKKYLYKLSHVVPVQSFQVPETCIKHGRTWCEYIPAKQ